MDLNFLITAGTALGALTGIITLFIKAVHWFDRQKAQDQELALLRVDLQDLRTEESGHIHEIKEEQSVLTYGILACLKGLSEQGCNGPVTEAIGKIEKYLNEKAHK